MTGTVLVYPGLPPESQPVRVEGGCSANWQAKGDCEDHDPVAV